MLLSPQQTAQLSFSLSYVIPFLSDSRLITAIPIRPIAFLCPRLLHGYSISLKV